MAQMHTQSIPREKFLTMAANLIHRALLDTTRTEAKKIYREIAAGKVVALTEVEMEDKSRIRFDLALDQTELDNRLNFGAFRASVATLVNNLGESLRQEDKQITVFRAENNPEMTLFGVTAVTFEGEEPRVMVLAADTGSGRPVIELRLMYLDPGQFQTGAGDTETGLA